MTEHTQKTNITYSMNTDNLDQWRPPGEISGLGMQTIQVDPLAPNKR